MNSHFFPGLERGQYDLILSFSRMSNFTPYFSPTYEIMTFSSSFLTISNYFWWFIIFFRAGNSSVWPDFIILTDVEFHSLISPLPPPHHLIMNIYNSFLTRLRMIADNFFFFSELETGLYWPDLFILTDVKFHLLIPSPTRLRTFLILF